ncbi:hypothetical protein ACOMHN_015375 [Nucella lapillus]
MPHSLSCWKKSDKSRGTVTCPSACTCEREEVRCANSPAMKELPQLLPNNDTLRSLQMTRVNFTTLTPSSFLNLRHLTTLDLHNSLIANLSDGTFQNLPELQTLILRRNPLRQLTDQTFAGLEGLEVLDLSWNKFVELNNRWFQHLTGLKTLNLARNTIELIHGDAFFGLVNLQDLNLARNKVMTLSNTFLAPLTSLQSLTVDDNSIRVIDDDSFSAQSSLTRLSLTGNRDLRSVQANAFVSQSKVLALEELSLKGTHLMEVPVEMLKTLPALKTLDLSQTAISVVRGRSFSLQSNLLNLTLDSLPALTSIEAQAFEGLTRLETLVISNNELLSHVSWGVFRNLTHLRYLDLHNNKLETVRSGQADWGNIHIVDLRGNPLRCDCHTGWILSLLLNPTDNQSDPSADKSPGGQSDSAAADNTRPGLSGNFTCSITGTHMTQPDKAEVSTVAFTRQIRCHMPPDLHGKCLASLSAHQFRCPRAPAPRTRPPHEDRRMIVAVVAASITCFFLLTCGLMLKFRRRLCSTCSRQYRYRAHWNHGMNGSSPTADNGDIVDFETTHLEDFDSDIETSVRP